MSTQSALEAAGIAPELQDAFIQTLKDNSVILLDNADTTVADRIVAAVNAYFYPNGVPGVLKHRFDNMGVIALGAINAPV
jgi:hypothetical protein